MMTAADHLAGRASPEAPPSPPTPAFRSLSLGDEEPDTTTHTANGHSQGPEGSSPEAEGLQQLLHDKEAAAAKLAGTLAHYRAWASQLQSRYQAYNPEAARPARRIYVGGLPPEGTVPLEESNRSSLESTHTDGGPIAMQLCSSGSGPYSSGELTGSLKNAHSAQMTAALRNHLARDTPPSRKGSGDMGLRVNRIAAHASHLETDLRHFVNKALAKAGACVGPGHPITSCKVYPDKWYAFLEFRSVEEASNCMALDGISYKGSVLRVRRPNNYDPDVAIMLGVTEPDPSLDIAPQDLVRTVVPDTPHKLFLGGLPCDWTEDQVKGLLLPFGALRAFNLVQDRLTGNSKGYAFCEYMDVGRTDTVIQALNAKQIGKRFLTAKRAVAPPGGVAIPGGTTNRREVPMGPREGGSY